MTPFSPPFSPALSLSTSFATTIQGTTIGTAAQDTGNGQATITLSGSTDQETGTHTFMILEYNAGTYVATANIAMPDNSVTPVSITLDYAGNWVLKTKNATAVNGDSGADLESAIAVGNNVATAPSAPRNVSVSSAGVDASNHQNKATISWTAPAITFPNMTYVVQRDGSTRGTGITGTSFTDTDVLSGTHTYKVKAVAKDIANTPWSGPYSAGTNYTQAATYYAVWYNGTTTTGSSGSSGSAVADILKDGHYQTASGSVVATFDPAGGFTFSDGTTGSNTYNVNNGTFTINWDYTGTGNAIFDLFFTDANTGDAYSLDQLTMTH